jgi:hypothetical protein
MFFLLNNWLQIFYVPFFYFFYSFLFLFFPLFLILVPPGYTPDGERSGKLLCTVFCEYSRHVGI